MVAGLVCVGLLFLVVFLLMGTYYLSRHELKDSNSDSSKGAANDPANASVLPVIIFVLLSSIVFFAMFGVLVVPCPCIVV